MSTEKGKEIHYRVMRIMGYFTLAIGLAAAYLAFSSGDLPAIFYGHLFAPASPTPPAAKNKRQMVLLNLSGAPIIHHPKN